MPAHERVASPARRGIPALLRGARLGAPVALPLLACALQFALWPLVQPFAWFLFYPAVFAASWVGGLRGGLIATAVATPLAWLWFIPPVATFVKEPRYLIAAASFVGMGVMFAAVHGRLQATERAIRRANERLAELDRLKSQLFANVSHELRTPLALILAPVERLLSRADLGDEDRGTLESVVRNARLLRGHVEDLLELATVEAGRMRVERSPCDLAALVRRVAHAFDALAAERRLTLKVEADGVTEAEVDPEKVQRVLLNLLSNACKFTPEGGVVRVSLRRGAGRAVLEVADSGPGIPEAQREVVFERFRQLEGTAARRFGGTGLGLSIAREIARLHGGDIAVGDAIEGGASFVVTLPLVAPRGSRIEAPRELPPAVAVEGAPRRGPAGPIGGLAEGPLVLVVEDNPDLNRFLCEVLGERYRVASAFDGAEGVRLALELRPDLVLTDLMMPGTSGEDLVRELRARSDMEETPIVALTARADDSLREALLRGGAQDWVGKPFVTGELLARVENLVAARRARVLLRRREEELRAIFEGASVGIALVRADGRFLSFNERYRRMLGYAREDLMGKSFLDVTHPEDREANRASFDEAVRTGKDRYLIEKRYVRADGEPVWVRVDCGIMRDERGDVTGVAAVVEDIGERRRAEAELRRLAEMRERVATEAAGMGVWDLDLRTGELTWSDSHFRLLGYEPSPDGRASVEMWRSRIADADLPLILDAIDVARRERTLYAHAHVFTRAGDGRTAWARAFGRFLYDEVTGEPVRFVGMAFDDTELHAAERARREAEERLGLLVHAVRDYAMFALDPEGRIVSWNEGAERLYGYREAEALGLHRSVFFEREDASTAARHLQAAADAGSVQMEGWRLRRDGSRFWAEGVVTARRDESGAVAGFLVVTRDLTQRRAAEERFRLALEAAPSGMVMVDTAGRIVLVNRAAEHLFGYAREELIGLPVEVLVPAHRREAHVAHRRGFLQAPSARVMGQSRDLWGVRRDGSALPVEIGLTPVHGEEELFVVAAVVDITERRRAEREVREANARLLDRIADLEAFSYTVTHDLRAPLRAIEGYARFVEEELAEGASPRCRQMLGRMRDAATRMDHLVRDVLGYSQISREALATGPVDLDAVVRHVLTNYPEVAAAGVTVVSPLGRVIGQDSLLVQILSNLLGNAVRFVPKERAPRIEVRSERREGGLLRVVVEDNGVGIPSEHWERIFRPFERLRPTPEWPGTGIGLAIVKKAVERLGGRVGVESQPGIGSRFWFELREAADAP